MITEEQIKARVLETPVRYDGTAAVCVLCSGPKDSLNPLLCGGGCYNHMSRRIYECMREAWNDRVNHVPPAQPTSPPIPCVGATWKWENGGSTHQLTGRNNANDGWTVNGGTCYFRDVAFTNGTLTYVSGPTGHKAQQATVREPKAGDRMRWTAKVERLYGKIRTVTGRVSDGFGTREDGNGKHRTIEFVSDTPENLAEGTGLDAGSPGSLKQPTQEPSPKPPAPCIGRAATVRAATCDRCGAHLSEPGPLCDPCDLSLEVQCAQPTCANPGCNKPVAYPGARFCGAACCAEYESSRPRCLPLSASTYEAGTGIARLSLEPPRSGVSAAELRDLAMWPRRRK